MKTVYALCVALLLTLPVVAQETSGPFGFHFSAGTSLTLVPSFDHTVIIADGMVIPNYIHPSNSYGLPRYSVVTSGTRVMPGWYVEGGVSYQLSKTVALSVSASLRKIRYDYHTTLNDPGPVSIDDINDKYGNTSLLYLTITPLNISKTCFNEKLKIGIGPVLNFLLSDKTYNTVAIYNSAQSVELMLPDKVYFDTVGKFNKTMVGANLDADVSVAGPVSVRMTAQYFFSSVYDNEGVYSESEVETVKPIVVQVGLTWSLK